jgi:ribosomal protein S15P/S13E
MAHELAGVTTCNICQKKFTGPSALLIGSGNPNARLIAYVQSLATHLLTDHKDHQAALQLSCVEYLGMLQLLNFSSTDPAIREQTDFLRWRIHQQTAAHTVPDDKLKQKAADTAADLLTEAAAILHKPAGVLLELVTAKFVSVLTEMRDVIEERGRYTVSMVTVPQNSKNGPH